MKSWQLVCVLLAAACVGVSAEFSFFRATQGGESLPIGNKDFSLDRAHHLLFLSYSAFCPAETLADWSCTWCGPAERKSEVKFVHDFSSEMWSGNMYGFVSYGKKDKAVYITFRGSHGIMTWLYNFMTVQTQYPYCDDCFVHLGFHKGYNNVRDEVIEHVKTAFSECEECDRIYITGHSLGGALATMCAMDFIDTKQFSNKPITLYTFGGPRTGNDKWAKHVQESLTENGLFRVTHGSDPVPRLPPTLIGFKHAPREVYNPGQDEKYELCDPKNGEDPKCSKKNFAVKVLDHALYLGYNILDSVDGKEPCESTILDPIRKLEGAVPEWALENMTASDRLMFQPARTHHSMEEPII